MSGPCILGMFNISLTWHTLSSDTDHTTAFLVEQSPGCLPLNPPLRLGSQVAVRAPFLATIFQKCSGFCHNYGKPRQNRNVWTQLTLRNYCSSCAKGKVLKNTPVNNGGRLRNSLWCWKTGMKTKAMKYSLPAVCSCAGGVFFGGWRVWWGAVNKRLMLFYRTV